VGEIFYRGKRFEIWKGRITSKERIADRLFTSRGLQIAKLSVVFGKKNGHKIGFFKEIEIRYSVAAGKLYANPQNNCI